MRIIATLASDTSGVTVIEYGLLTGLIAIAALVGIGQVGNALGNTLFTASNEISTAQSLPAKS